MINHDWVTIYNYEVWYMHDLCRSMSYNSVRRAAWQIIQALHSLDISTVGFYVALNYWWGLKRNPAGCTPKDLTCPISDPAVFLTWCWPNIINLPLTFRFAMWHERWKRRYFWSWMGSDLKGKALCNQPSSPKEYLLKTFWGELHIIYTPEV